MASSVNPPFADNLPAQQAVMVPLRPGWPGLRGSRSGRARRATTCTYQVCNYRYNFTVQSTVVVRLHILAATLPAWPT